MKNVSLEDILYAQRELQAEMGNPMGSGEASVKENMLALIVEATEVLDEINWKPWAKKTGKVKAVDRDKLKTELVDVLQFWANAVNDYGFTPQEIARAYYDKLQVCYQRLHDEQRRKQLEVRDAS